MRCVFTQPGSESDVNRGDTGASGPGAEIRLLEADEIGARAVLSQNETARVSFSLDRDAGHRCEFVPRHARCQFQQLEAGLANLHNAKIGDDEVDYGHTS